VIVGSDASRTGIEPLGVGEGWAASRHTVTEGVGVASLVVARGAVEVRAHLVSGAAPRTPVRVTGWAAQDGARSELLPVHGLSGAGEGVTRDAASLFVVLVRLTAEPAPLPLTELVSVRVAAPEDGRPGAYDLTVTWTEGETAGFRFEVPAASSVSMVSTVLPVGKVGPRVPR
jgi:hypothetical protein